MPPAPESLIVRRLLHGRSMLRIKLDRVESADGLNYRPQRRRYLRFGVDGDALLPADLEVVHLRSKGIGDRRSRTTENNSLSAVGDRVDVEILRLQPDRNRVDVVRGDPEALADLNRREPMVVIRRRWVLLVLQELRVRLFPLGRAVEDNGQSLNRQIGGNRADVVLSIRPCGVMASQGNAIRGVDTGAHEIGGLRLRQARTWTVSERDRAFGKLY